MHLLKIFWCVKILRLVMVHAVRIRFCKTDFMTYAWIGNRTSVDFEFEVVGTMPLCPSPPLGDRDVAALSAGRRDWMVGVGVSA